MTEIILNGEVVELTPELEAEIYAEDPNNQDMSYYINRAAAYPSYGDQFDMMYHDQTDGTTTWYDTIASIKAQYPKPQA